VRYRSSSKCWSARCADRVSRRVWRTLSRECCAQEHPQHQMLPRGWRWSDRFHLRVVHSSMLLHNQVRLIVALGATQEPSRAIYSDSVFERTRLLTDCCAAACGPSGRVPFSRRQPTLSHPLSVRAPQSINALLDILPELTLITQEIRWSTCSTHWAATIGYPTQYVQYFCQLSGRCECGKLIK